MKNLKLLFLALLLLGANAASVLAESATITISNLESDFNGNPQGVVVETVPQGIPVEVLYNGSAEQPTNAGNYSVTATITDPNFEGSATANFEINKVQVQLEIGNLQNLQQTFNGRYLPVSVDEYAFCVCSPNTNVVIRDSVSYLNLCVFLDILS